MTLEIVRIADTRGVLQTVCGVRTGDELLAGNRRMFFERTADFAACRFWYADFTGSDLRGVGADHIRELAQIAEQAASANPSLLTAIVTPEDLQYGLGRMWATITEATGWECRTFRSREEASAWLAERLDLPRDELLRAHGSGA